ncbi:hypothetical protein G6M89_09580 [Natronolimnobius sp. AArcel1]|uniref:FxLYD domain-containing protein n=1 Tax=Natronolimnobius sp. AArcel1 TaxID=1679093 RepID=UPI0013E9E775|nr:FxLYD domain-containing protein [Natronolimnobius sp. AArcel1]NGM69254.1 hypothetical protein [Natronolimnobius sp. AArcel1]
MDSTRRVLLCSIGSAGAVALAGCTGSVGLGDDPSVEVTENEFDALEIDDHEVENQEVLGTDAVVATGTVTNTGDETVTATIGAKFYDSDDVLLGEDEPGYSGTEISPDQSQQYQQAIDGDASDIDYVELRVVEPGF